MTTVVPVTRTERAAARLRRELDKRAGRKTDPRVDVIADATVIPETVRATATVASEVSVNQARSMIPGTNWESLEDSVDALEVGVSGVTYIVLRDRTDSSFRVIGVLDDKLGVVVPVPEGIMTSDTPVAIGAALHADPLPDVVSDRPRHRSG